MRSKHLHAKKKKKVSCPAHAEPGGSMPPSSNSEDITSTSSGGMEVMAAVRGPSHRCDAQASSNIPA